jgi:hypothetical protein
MVGDELDIRIQKERGLTTHYLLNPGGPVVFHSDPYLKALTHEELYLHLDDIMQRRGVDLKKPWPEVRRKFREAILGFRYRMIDIRTREANREVSRLSRARVHVAQEMLALIDDAQPPPDSDSEGGDTEGYSSEDEMEVASNATTVDSDSEYDDGSDHE